MKENLLVLTRIKCVLLRVFCYASNPNTARNDNALVTFSSILQLKQEQLEDYENISAAWAAVTPNLYDYDDSDTSEEQVEVNYTQVTFKPNAGHQRADSSSSVEEVQYSEVKI